MFRYTALTLGLWAAAIPSISLAETGDPQALLIEQGYFWQDKDKPKRAAESWEKVLLLNASQPIALYGLGIIAVESEQLSIAKDYLKRLQAIEPLPYQASQLEQDIRLGNPENKKLMEDARLLVDNGEREEAVKIYRQALGGKPAHGLVGREFYNNLAFTEGNWSEARSGFERLMRNTPDDVYIALFFAKHLARRDDTRVEGIRALAELAKREDIGGDADETWRLALTWMGAPNKAQAPLFETFLKSHPDDTEIRELLAKGRAKPEAAAAVAWQQDPGLARGLKALEAGDQATAEREIATRLKSHPNDADALGGMGVLRQQQNKLEDAEVLLTRATRQKGGKSWQSALNDVRYWSLLQRATDNRAKGDVKQARSQLDQAIRLKPNDINGPLALADLQASTAQYAAAEAGYRRLLKQYPDNQQVRRGLIAVLGQSGKNDQALSLINTLPKAEQGKIEGLGRIRAEQAMQRAKLAEQRGDREGMRAALEDALRIDPNDPWARFALARVYVAMGAITEARSLVDGLLVSQPNNPDALYTSALLSVQLDELPKAQASLARIPQNARNADINRLLRDVDFNLQLQQIKALTDSGQRQEARVFLNRIEPLADGQQGRQESIASAYAEAGDPKRAISLMRDLLARSPRQDPGLTLRYAGVLLQADQDVEASSILRNMQGQPLDVEQRKQYDDVLFLYRVRQAEQLRERGDLVSAYDTLAPALAERPQSSLAISALARMYAASGEPAKALELYKPVVQREPKNAQLLIGAADMAAQVHERDYAEDALERALALAPGDPDVLTTAARIYRFQGRTGTAAELLKKVVAQEKRQESAAFAASAPASAASNNPFAARGAQGQSAAPAAAIPPPVQSLPPGQTSAFAAPAFAQASGTSSADPLLAAPMYAPTYAGADPLLNQASAPLGYTAQSAPAQQPLNPFSIEQQNFDPRASMSPAERALDDVLQQRSGYVVQGLEVQANDSESGLSKLTTITAPNEVNIPIGDNRLAVRVTPVSLNAGSVSGEAASRFGAGPTINNFTDSPGSQKDAGVGLAVAFESPAVGLKADLGTTPQGFLYSTLVGGVSLNRAFTSTENLRWDVNLSRRPVTDSLLSFAGAEDRRTGQKWGGVTANGGRGEVSFDNREVGLYGYGALHQLQGNNVESNNRGELGGGAYWYLMNNEDSLLTTGVSVTAMSYEKNSGHYTYGHGGYFSPRTFFALGAPVTFAQRFDNFSYQIKGSLGVQYIDQADADYFPGDANLQANATNVLGREAVYEGSSKVGIGYSLYGAAEYQMAQNFFFGGHLGLDNAQDYRQWSSGLYLRYMFEDMTQPMPLPVSPYRSPYSK
jgi:tetratricopeptide (TPR) repeat protein